jgi:23S rRNA pseudouridine2457 synthase
MTAAVGFPTLRLIRYSIGDWNIEGLPPGESKVIESFVTFPSKTPNKGGRSR